jgi:hypothetical protein
MYIVIFEDGAVTKTNRIDECDLSAADGGIIDIIDITNPEDPQRYYVDGEWVEVDDFRKGL